MLFLITVHLFLHLKRDVIGKPFMVIVFICFYYLTVKRETRFYFKKKRR